MVGVIVVSHGLYAQESVHSAAMLVGEGERIAYAGVLDGDSPDAFYEHVMRMVHQVDDGDGVVALVDLYGGTPNNTVFRLKKEENIRIITGFNLPMLIYAITERTADMTQDELVEALIRVGTSQIKEFGS